jgi:general secretion pathway protein D
MRYLFSATNKELTDSEVLIVLTPHIVRMPEWTKENLRALYSGSETYPSVRRELDVKAPTSNPSPSVIPSASPASIAPAPVAGNAPIPVATPASGTPAPMASGAGPSQVGGAPQVNGPRVRFEPGSVSLSVGQTSTVGIAVDNVSDLYSVPLMIQYNPAVVSIEEARNGSFLSGGTQDIAVVQRVDKEHGQAIISATRQPNTPGVSGSGTLLGIVIKGIAPGSSNLSIVQINAKDSQQKPIPLVTSEGVVRVQ